MVLNYHLLQKELTRNEIQHRELLNSMSESIIKISKTGKVLYCNKSELEINEIKNVSENNQSLISLFHKKNESNLPILDFLQHFILLPDFERRIQLNHQNKGKRWFQVNVSFIKNAENIPEIILVLKDATTNLEFETDKRKTIIEAEETERQRLAHDLHDGLGQTIAAASMYVNAMENKIKLFKNESLTNNFNRTKELVNAAVIETRSISHNIMPSSLNQFGIERSVVELTARLNEINPKLHIKTLIELNEKRFDPVIEMTVYRVIQEIVNNTIKHSKASFLQIKLLFKNNVLHIVTTDNGVGMDSKTITKKGLGLTSLNNRIESVKGEITLFSFPNEGIKFKIKIPVKPLKS